jgi:hypothetical protein
MPFGKDTGAGGTDQNGKPLGGADGPPSRGPAATLLLPISFVWRTPMVTRNVSDE